MKKIKLTETQLKKLQQKLQEEYMQVNELGKEEYSYDGGNFTPGQSKGPSPNKMAKIVINNIKLHPSYYKDREKMYAFLDAITNMLVDEVEAGGLKKRDYDSEMLNVDEPQLNERRKLNEQPASVGTQTTKSGTQKNQNATSKIMQQISKTYPTPPQSANEQETKKGPDVDSPDLLADRKNFKSFFPGINVETFRVGLYKYIYSNKNNPKLIDRLLKILYKP